MTEHNTKELLNLNDADLSRILAADESFVSAIFGSFPESSHHVGFDLFDPSWIRNNGRAILRSIGRAVDVENLNWAESTIVGLAVDSIANDLLRYLGLPQTSLFVCAALVVLILRSIKAKD
jgi:hypothetical protein